VKFRVSLLSMTTTSGNVFAPLAQPRNLFLIHAFELIVDEL
jgi:hypothetical protein